MSKNLVTVDVRAGQAPDGETVIEKLMCIPQEEKDQFQLVKSPAFARGIAADDIIKVATDGMFSVQKHSGKLCIRVYCREDSEAVEENLTPLIEKLGGDRDIISPRLLVYSIHVNYGFSDIEAAMEKGLKGYQGVQWAYGNVYNPDNGEPLNWWDEFINTL